MIGPIATPTPEMPAQIPIARPRSGGGNTLVRIDSVDGMMNAAPKPWIARVKIRMPAEPANADASDPAPKMNKPASNAGLRP